MTETIRQGRHSGWSAAEDNLLWETADEAQQQGQPLKAVFERIAALTGRRPNSIRNYYYAQAKEREGLEQRRARFVPFEEEETERLVETVLREKAQGSSVRACLNRAAKGDKSLMLRYQNKYRAVLKTRPELVEKVLDRLKGEGVVCDTPSVRHREKTTMPEAADRLCEGARRTGDMELIRACEVLTARLLSMGEATAAREDRERGDKVRYDLCRMALQDAKRELADLCEAVRPMMNCIKEQLAEAPKEENPFLRSLQEMLAPVEEAVSRAEA